jgi:hypothetical protein
MEARRDADRHAVHNAGIAAPPTRSSTKTNEGLGIMYTTNFSGSYLMTHLLESSVSQTARPPEWYRRARQAVILPLHISTKKPLVTRRPPRSPASLRKYLRKAGQSLASKLRAALLRTFQAKRSRCFLLLSCRGTSMHMRAPPTKEHAEQRKFSRQVSPRRQFSESLMSPGRRGSPIPCSLC